MEKICSKCKKIKTYAQFHKCAQTKTGYKNACKECCDTKRWESKRTKKIRQKLMIDLNGNVFCIKCCIFKPVDEFYIYKHKPRLYRKGTSSYCKKCDITRRISINKKNNIWSPKRFLNKCFTMAKNSSDERQLFFNITQQDLYDIFDKQQGLCAISGEKMTCIRFKGRVATNISIDRIDSKIGYEKNNIQLVCYIINVMKHEGTKNDLIFWCKKIIDLSLMVE